MFPLHWSINFIELSPLALSFSVDLVSFLFLSTLFLISLTIVSFANFYLSVENLFRWFIFLLLIFILSIVLLALSNSVFLLFLAWDGLGVSSFFLVFYYLNWDCINNAIITLITNRLGDALLFWFVGPIFISILYFGPYVLNINGLVLVLIGSSFTNSAQFPFSAWLPNAISAPTPISALVHSSTLVTAGVFLLLKFNSYFFNVQCMLLLISVGIITIFFASLSALVEVDFNNVVALSTLSQMGFLILSLGVGIKHYTMIHLLSHALINSTLFIQIGYIMHSNYGNQDSRQYNNSGFNSLTSCLQIIICLISLCGLFFTSGFVSNDLLLEIFIISSEVFVFIFLFLLSLFLTFLYCFRLFNVFLSLSNSSLSFQLNSEKFITVCWVLLLGAIISMWWLSYTIFFYPTSLLYSDNLIPLGFLFIFILINSFYNTLNLIYNSLFSLFFANSLINGINSFIINPNASEIFLLVFNNNVFSFLLYTSNFSSLILNFYSINSTVFGVLLLAILIIM